MNDDRIDLASLGLDDFHLDLDAPPRVNPIANVDAKTVGSQAEAEVSAVLAAFKDRQKQEKKRLDDTIDSEYWVCVCFLTREDKEAFLARWGIDRLGDKYLDGYDVDAALKTKTGTA